MSDNPYEASESPEAQPQSAEIPPEILEHQREVNDYAVRSEANGLTRRQVVKRIGIAGLTVGPFASVLAAAGNASAASDAKAAAAETAADVRSGKAALRMFASNGGMAATWWAQGYRQQKFYCGILGIQYQYADGQFSPPKQRAAIENAAQQKWDFAHFDLFAPGTCDAPIKQMIKNGTIVFEGPGQVTRPGVEIGVKSWMHQDNHQMGYDVGLALFEAAGGKKGGGNVIITKGPSTAVQVPVRAQGFKDAMSQYPGFKLVAEDFGNWDPNRTTQLWSAYANRYKDIAVGYFENDDMAFAGLKVLKSAGRGGKTKIGGCDGMPPACLAVKSGQFVATYRHSSERVHVSPIFIGRAMKMGLLSDKALPRDLKLDGPLVTKDNADSVRFLEQDNVFLI